MLLIVYIHVYVYILNDINYKTTSVRENSLRSIMCVCVCVCVFSIIDFHKIISVHEKFFRHTHIHIYIYSQ
jgi:hypothetical protein